MWLNTFSHIENIFHIFIRLAISISSLVKYLFIFFAGYSTGHFAAFCTPYPPIKKKKTL